MSKLFNYNDILVGESQLPSDFGETQAQKDLEKFKEKLIDAFNEDEVSDEFIEELDEISSEMRDGKSIKFKDVDELAERYGL